MNEKNLHIAVLMGGPSAEREVSLCSGAAVAEALQSIGHRATSVVLSAEQRKVALGLPLDVDVVFIALHGEFGEDGQVQQILENLGVPYTGCGVEASRLCMDKIASKQLFIEMGIPTPASEVLHAHKSERLLLSPPVVVKPPQQGSSVGVHVVERAEHLAAALADAFRYDDKALVEEFVWGRELTIAILGDQTLPIVEICPKDGFYDFQNKYTSGATEYVCPALLDERTAAQVNAAARCAFDALGCRDFGRVDVRLRSDGTPFVLEINTLPGMTKTSLFPKAAAAAGIEFSALCEQMVEMAMERTPSAVRR